MTKYILSAALIACTNLFAQDSVNIASTAAHFNFSGYIEVYYQYDFNKPADHNRPGFIYSHNRHNEFNLNLGFLKGSYNAGRVRANLALAAGTYMNANYAAETGVLKNIFEANAGLKISKKRNLWIDAGIFSSHIGFESAVSKDCRVLTRSLMADNSPYFETGAKITYTGNNNKWMFSGLLLNGWQRITRVPGNQAMSYGTQLQYRPNSKVLINHSSFFGTDKPDSNRLWRYFNNLYGIFNVTGNFEIIAGIDIGAEQQSKGSKSMNNWYAPVLILRYSITDKWAIAARGEYYNDPNEVIIVTGTANGFQASGFSFNLDYAPLSNALIRFEARNLKSKDPVFEKEQGFTDNNFFITTSIAVSF